MARNNKMSTSTKTCNKEYIVVTSTGGYEGDSVEFFPTIEEAIKYFDTLIYVDMRYKHIAKNLFATTTIQTVVETIDKPITEIHPN